MSGAPTAVLTNHLQSLLSGRRVTAAVFATFTLEPQFFEEEVLPLLADDELVQEPRMRLVQLEEQLRGEIGPVAVYYDQAGLRADGSPRLDVRYVPVRVPTGLFHPKLVLVLTAPRDQNSRLKPALICGVLSANLCQDAWWRSLECAHFEVLEEGGRASIRDDLRKCLLDIRGLSAREDGHDALDRIREWLRYSLSDTVHSTEAGRLRTRLIAGTRSLLDAVDDVRGAAIEGRCLEVVSPFFDKEDPKPLASLIERFSFRETRVFLPTAADGSVLCSPGIYEGIRSLNGVRWGRLPEDLLKLGKELNAPRRGVHAKVYRFIDRTQRLETLLVGSHNLTSAAHQRGGNFEASVLIERESPGPIDWWLSIDSGRPKGFAEPTDHEDEAGDSFVPLQVRFDWTTRRSEARWDGASTSPALRVRSAGELLFEVTSLPKSEWQPLADAASDALERILVSTSILEIVLPNGTSGAVLVQESGMTRKPSILLSLSATDILEYWSRLSPAQRAEYLSSRAGNVPGVFASDEVSPSLVATESFFSTYAGIFHGFEMLRKQVHEALAASAERRVDHLLFGRRHDSLPSLIARVVDGGEGMDNVSRYLTLLCARQLLQELRGMQQAVFVANRKEIDALSQQTRAADGIAAELDLGANGQEFLGWFERHFARNLRDQGSHLHA